MHCGTGVGALFQVGITATKPTQQELADVAATQLLVGSSNTNVG